MKLLKTNDGLIGWKITDKVIWCSNIEELKKIGWSHIRKNNSDLNETTFTDEISFAINTMAQMNHSLAHFGVLGHFIYSEIE